MRRAGCAALFPALLTIAVTPAERAPVAAPGVATRAEAVPARAPQPFEENRGQAAGGAGFLTRGDGYAARLDADGIDLRLPIAGAPWRAEGLRLTLVGGGAVGAPFGTERLRGKVNYLVGADARHWITDVPTFGAIRYSEVRPGIDLTVRGDFRRLALDFAVGAGADAGAIALAIDDAGAGRARPDRSIDVSTGEEGALLIATGSARVKIVPHPGVVLEATSGLLTLRGPAVSPGEERVLHITFERIDARAGGDDRGGDDRDAGTEARVAVDPDGHLYLAGRALTASFGDDTGTAARTPFADAGQFVSRRDRDAVTPRYTTYLEGRADERRLALAAGETHEALLTSTGRPGGAAPDGSAGPTATHLSADGTSILAVRPTPSGEVAGSAVVPGVIPGAAADVGADARVTDVALDPKGRPVVAGFARSPSWRGRQLLEPAPAGGLLFAAPIDDAAPAPADAGCPGTIQFDRSAGTNLWQTATNWDLDRLPTTTDDVCIPTGFTVSMGAGALPIGTLYVASGSSLTVAGSGTLSIAAGSLADGPLTLSGGVITGAGTLDLAAALTWTSGTMTGAGTVNANAGMALSGSGLKDLTAARVLNAFGSVTTTGSGGMRVGTGASVHNAGTWEAQSDAAITLTAGGAALFDNMTGATYRKNGGTGISTIDIPFDNAGTVYVMTGTLNVSAGGTGAGTFQGTGSATLRFGGGAYLLGAASSVSVPSFSVTAGTVDVIGAFTSGSTSISSGVLTFLPAATLNALGTGLTVSGGTLALGSGEAIALTSMTHSNGTISGGDTVTVANPIAWSGGTWTGAGTLNASGGLTLTGSGLKDITQSRVLNVGGTSSWSGSGAIRMGTGAVLHNAGTFTAQSDATLSITGAGPALFDNQAGAIFRKSGTAGTTTVGVTFDNQGTVDLLTGTLSLSGGGTGAGPITGAAGSTLRFGGGTHLLGAGASLDGVSVAIAAGTVEFSCPYAAAATSTTAGTTTFHPAATLTTLGSALTVDGGVLNLDSGEPVPLATLSLIAGTIQGADILSVSGAATWSGGSMGGSGITNTDGGLNLSTVALKDLTGSRRLNAAGTTHWAGPVRVGGTASIHNSGTWQNESDTTMSALAGGPGSFRNLAGATYRKIAGAGTTTVGVPLDNDGTLDIQTGTLSLGGGGTGTGSFTGSPGAVLAFTGGTHTLTGTSSLTVPTVSITAGDLAVHGNFAPATATTIASGTATFHPAANVSGLGQTLTIGGGTITLNSGEEITVDAMSIGGGTLAGGDTLNVMGPIAWSSGTMTGGGITVAMDGMTLSGPGLKDLTLGRQLVTMAGDVHWSGSGDIRLSVDANIHNEGADWQVQSDAGFTDIGAGGSFLNHAAGAFRKTGGAGATRFGIAFDSEGACEVQSGTIDLGDGGVSSGAFTGAPGATLRFSAGPHTLTDTSSVVVPNVVVAGGTLDVHGGYAAATGTTVSGGAMTFHPDANAPVLGGALSIAAGTLTLDSGEPLGVATLGLGPSGGTLQGGDTLSVSGATTWTGGTMAGTGVTNADGGAAMIGFGLKDLTGSRRLNLGGASTWSGTGSVRLAQDAVIHNAGTFDAQSDAGMTRLGLGGSLFENAAGGTFRKSSGAGTTSFLFPFTNAGTVRAQSGTLSFGAGYLQSAGATSAEGGTITSSAPLDIQGGSVGGTSTIGVGVVNGGSLVPGLSPGSITISGALTQGAAAAFDVEIGGLTPGTQHDRAVVTGAATLSGTLNVTLVNGFVPQDHDTFTILTFASSTGEFTTMNLPDLGGDLSWKYHHNATSIQLEALADIDADGVSNVNDCAPYDPTAWAIPGDATILISLDGQTVSWSSLAAQAGPALVYDVMRGAIGQWPVGSGAAETCLAPDTPALSAGDSATPAVGTGFYYLVRGVNVCGIGTYGTRSNGTPRVTPVCP